ncbi:MAG: DUF3592 domain-containing protein [Chloroflexi bacterium]|nr:DUF3592 domain-containing protein [Chloroflexota bacterium]
MQKSAPTFLQIIARDYLAQNYFAMIFGGWVVYLIDVLFKGNFTLFLAAFAAILTLAGLALFYLRYSLISSTFANGREIMGQVTEIRAFPTGKKNADTIIQYEYTFNGRTHRYKNRVKKNAYADALRQGQSVVLLAHEETPHAAFIKGIYLE